MQDRSRIDLCSYRILSLKDFRKGKMSFHDRVAFLRFFDFAKILSPKISLRIFNFLSIFQDRVSVKVKIELSKGEEIEQK